MPGGLVRNAASMPASSIIRICSSRSYSTEFGVMLGTPSLSKRMAVLVPAGSFASSRGMK